MRSTLTCPIIITFSLAASLAACSLVEEVPERTTLEMPTDGAELLSADGLFGVRFDPAQFTTASPVSIQTIRDLSVDGVVSLTYEVQSAVALPTALEVFHLSAQFDDPSSMALATVDGDRAAALASTWDVAQGWLVSTDVGVTQRRFAVVELGIRDNQCLASACGTVCTYCDPLVASCQDDLGECNRTGACVPAGATPCNDYLDGWDDPPADGLAFVIDSIAIAEANRGFDIDGQCTATGCLDNALAPLGPLLDDLLRQSLLGGELLLGFELAGLDMPFRGDDASLTLKHYAFRDADDPFFPANNFRVPPGFTECCQFKLVPQSLAGDPPQARSRAPSRLERARLRTLAPIPMQVTLALGTPPHPEIRIERTLVSARVTSDLTELLEGLIGGAIPINTLAQTENPFCRTQSPACPIAWPEGSSMLDYVSTYLSGRADVDVDFDGLECVLDTDGDGLVDCCCDGGSTCSTTCANPVPPVDPANPGSCAWAPQMADAYSIALEFTAVRAEIVP